MGVYIKSMEMPKNCMECPFSDHEAWCLIPGDPKKRYYCPTKEISEDCPLVEVPEPHGRLIDADALIKALIRKEPFNDCARVVIAECMQEVRHAPTVIEAEDEG